MELPSPKRRRVTDENSEFDHNLSIDREQAKSEKLNEAKKRSHPVGRQSQPDAFNGVYVGNTYKSNLFKLKVDELLKQVEVDYARLEEPINALLRTLKEIIEAIPNRDPISVSSGREISGGG
jgi:U3 small nucleolar RNA-associated protein 22